MSVNITVVFMETDYRVLSGITRVVLGGPAEPLWVWDCYLYITALCDHFLLQSLPAGSDQFLLITCVCGPQVISSCSCSLHFDLWFDQPPVSHWLLCVHIKLLLTHTCVFEQQFNESVCLCQVLSAAHWSFLISVCLQTAADQLYFPSRLLGII